MAEKKISELTAKGANLDATDLLVISEDAGGGTYVTKSITGQEIIDAASGGGGGLTYFTEAENTSAPNGTVYVDSLTAAASSTNADFAIVPKGTGAILADIPDNTATGGNKRGQYAVDLQISRASASQVASGNYSGIASGANNTVSGAYGFASGFQNTVSQLSGVAIGYANTVSNQLAASIGRICTASGDSAAAIGYANTASGSSSIALGYNNTTSQSYSSALGAENIASGSYSVSIGQQADTFSIIGRQAFSSGKYGVSGDSQVSKFILKTRTTGNTATTLVTNTSAAGTTNQVILSNNSSYRFKGTIIGKQSGSTNVAAWDVDGLIVRGANAAATTLIVSNVNVVDNTPTFGTPTLAADTTNGGLQVQVTGVAATNIQWTANIETTEVIYA